MRANEGARLSVDRQFISYPKSGRSWIRYVLHLLALETTIRFHHDGCEFSKRAKPPLALDFEARIHMYKNSGPIVYLRRDPRDTMVSLYFQIKGRMGKIYKYDGDISSFIRDSYFGAANLIAFDRQWQSLCRRGTALCVSYEDCHVDLYGTMQKILSRYELPVDETTLHTACEEASFERMRAVEVGGMFGEPWLRTRNRASKTRRGVVGGYADYLSADDVVYIESLMLGEQPS